MTQPRSKSSKSKSKSKKTTTASTAKKVKRSVAAVKPVEVELETVATPAPLFTATAAATPELPRLAPVRLVTRAEFTDLVRKEAYRRYAARRAFKQGSPFQDWVNAEAAVSGKLAAEGARLS